MMENPSISPSIKKWIKKCLKEEFDSRVRDELTTDKSTYIIADDIIQSTELEELIKSLKTAYHEEREFLSSGRDSKVIESRSRTAQSYESDLSVDDWSPFKSPADQYAYVLEKISYDKPVHVRLAGYERLLESELSNLGNSESWDILLKTLRDGIADESRPVFEASLRVHAKLLDSSHSHDVYANLLSAFNAQYHTRKLHDTLPTLNTGINFKIFLHEKLFRTMRLVMNHQEEILKSVRTVDRFVEDMIEQFIVFLSPHTFGNSMQAKTLNTLNVLSVLEPQARWCRKWIHGLLTRKTFVMALTKSTSFLENIVMIVGKGLEKSPDSLAFSINDEEVFISGDTVETLTYLHCLNFLAQLSSYNAGRNLLSSSPFESSPSITDFSIALLNSLNILASSATISGVYNSSRDALRYILDRSASFADSRFYHVAMNPLMRSTNSEGKIWAHTLDVLNHMLDSKDGVAFITGDNRARSANLDEPPPRCPVVSALEHISKLLKQPFSVMNIEHVVQLFHFVGRLFGIHEIHGILEDTMKLHFFPAVAYLYGKMDKYAVGHESKTQYLDSAAKSMLLKIVASPIGLRTLVNESSVFEELIRGSIAPLRAPWNSSDIVDFVSSAAYFDLGSKIIVDLAPQSLSTALEEVSAVLEDPHNFHDPWDNSNLEKFLHVLSSLSLSTRCFIAFMADSGYEDNDEYNYPRTLRDLVKYSGDVESQYHYLGLLTINAFIWNLDIYTYLMSNFKFLDNMLKLQESCVHEIDEDGHIRIVNVIDSCSLLRHRIILNSYYIRHKLEKSTFEELEECVIFSKLPPPVEAQILPDLSRSTSSSELSNLLENSKPGLRDSGWVLEARKAYKNSSDSMKNSVLMDLLDQMQKAIPTAEWVDHFKWENDNIQKRDWSKEENLCFDLTIRYAEENCPFENIEQINDNIKSFFQATHKFINYTPPDKFEGFDWFLATVFLICEGKIDTCRKFVEQIIRFPSAMYMWPIFGIAIDRNNGEEMATQCLLGQHIEDVMNEELPTVNWAVKNYCGIHWWMICNRLMSQCFWGILPWTEIVHFFAICILHSADYIVYYFVSLMHHCQSRLMEDINNKKLWPDNLYFGDYHCHRQMSFIDRIGKRYRNKVLSTLTQRKFMTTE